MTRLLVVTLWNTNDQFHLPGELRFDSVRDYADSQGVLHVKDRTFVLNSLANELGVTKLSPEDAGYIVGLEKDPYAVARLYIGPLHRRNLTSLYIDQWGNIAVQNLTGQSAVSVDGKRRFPTIPENDFTRSFEAILRFTCMGAGD